MTNPSPNQPPQTQLDSFSARVARIIALKAQGSLGVEPKRENCARVIAERFNLTDLFDSIISKPGISVDDLGWAWTKYTITIHPDQIEQASFPIT